MEKVDKNKAVTSYLLNCEPIHNSPLYFNFANMKNGVYQFLTLTQDKNIEKPYIDGSVLKKYSMTVICFSAISNNPVVKAEDLKSENVSDMAYVQSLIDWIDEQNSNKNFPDFGEGCQVEEITTTTGNPRLDRIDATQSIPLARYSFTIQITYLDKSKMIWR